MKIPEAELARMEDWMRLKHRDHKTRKAYRQQVINYSHWLFARRAKLSKLSSEKKVEAFLTMRAKQGCSASTQNVAFHALRCFYSHGIGTELKDVDALRAKRPVRERRSVPRPEVLAILGNVQNAHGYDCRLILEWIYGNGLRISEPLNARIKDIDFEHSLFTVRDGKHQTDRVVEIPCSLILRIKAQSEIAKLAWMQDTRDEIPVPLPGRLALKYPRAQFSRGWSWLFPAKNRCQFEGRTMRWRIHEAVIQRACKAAVLAAGVPEDITPHHFRHAYATHVMRMGACARDVQEALGHKQLETTQGYMHPEIARVPCPLPTPEEKVILPFVAAA
jgi:site-specific recombinase XerD